MSIVLDSHVHFYGGIYGGMSANRIASQLRDSAPQELKSASLQLGLIVFNRGGLDCYEQFLSHNGSLISGENADDSSTVLSTEIGPLYCWKGFQFITKERLELLVAGPDLKPINGIPLADLLRLYPAQTHIRILPWSPGKWTLARARMVDDLLRSIEPNELYIGDIGMRPRFTPPPRAFNIIKQRGLRMLAGSDTLPLSYDWTLIGKYNSLIKTSQQIKSIEALRQALISSEIEAVGARNCIFTAIFRYLRNLANKRI